jgi:hypothetical protein
LNFFTLDWLRFHGEAKGSRNAGSDVARGTAIYLQTPQVLVDVGVKYDIEERASSRVAFGLGDSHLFAKNHHKLAHTLLDHKAFLLGARKRLLR